MIFAVPVDPDADQARDWILDELSDPRYEAARPTWFDQLSTAFFEWLVSLVESGAGGPTDLLLVIVAVVVVAALVAAFLIFGRPALNRRSKVSGELFGREDVRTAEQMRQAADAAASAGNWTVAIEKTYRAIARGLAERTILATTPGTTAHGFSERASAAFPHLADGLAAAADSFDRVRYLGRAGTEAEYRAVAAVELELRTARIAVRDSTGVPG